MAAHIGRKPHMMLQSSASPKHLRDVRLDRELIRFREEGRGPVLLRDEGVGILQLRGQMNSPVLYACAALVGTPSGKFSPSGRPPGVLRASSGRPPGVLRASSGRPPGVLRASSRRPPGVLRASSGRPPGSPVFGDHRIKGSGDPGLGFRGSADPQIRGSPELQTPPLRGGAWLPVAFFLRPRRSDYMGGTVAA
jgi:hypothetical protein